MSLVIRLAINAIAIWLAASWIDGISVITPDRGVGWDILVIVAIAAVFTVVNTLIKPIAMFFSLPLLILSLGLFTLVVNAAMLMLTSWITGHYQYGLTVRWFWPALWGGVIIAIVNWALGVFARKDRD